VQRCGGELAATGLSDTVPTRCSCTHTIAGLNVVSTPRSTVLVCARSATPLAASNRPINLVVLAAPEERVLRMC
jgi:hypothetical protein